MTLESDIVERVRQDFSPADAELAIALITDSRKHGRVARCIVVAAAGSTERLADLIRLAGIDYRDVIVSGEYCGDQHVRDLRVSFLIDRPEKFWIGDVATMMEARGYRLTSVESRPVPVPPGYASRGHEGVAKFVPVRTGLAGETMLEVFGDFKPGDQVVSGPYKALRELKPNAKVKPETEGKGRGPR